MARFHADENFPFPVVIELRRLGHDVLTAHEAGRANSGIPDEDVLAFATADGRAVLTLNRRHFVRLRTGGLRDTQASSSARSTPTTPGRQAGLRPA